MLRPAAQAGMDHLVRTVGGDLDAPRLQVVAHTPAQETEAVDQRIAAFLTDVLALVDETTRRAR